MQHRLFPSSLAQQTKANKISYYRFIFFVATHCYCLDSYVLSKALSVALGYVEWKVLSPFNPEGCCTGLTAVEADLGSLDVYSLA